MLIWQKMLLRKQAVLLQPESMATKNKRHFVQTLYRHHILKTPKLLILKNKTLPFVRVRVPLLAPDKPIENLEESRISMGSAELLDML